MHYQPVSWRVFSPTSWQTSKKHETRTKTTDPTQPQLKNPTLPNSNLEFHGQHRHLRDHTTLHRHNLLPMLIRLLALEAFLLSRRKRIQVFSSTKVHGSARQTWWSGSPSGLRGASSLCHVIGVSCVVARVPAVVVTCDNQHKKFLVHWIRLTQYVPAPSRH